MAEANILTAAELASVRREYRGATLLPKRTYHDAAIFDWERREIVRRSSSHLRSRNTADTTARTRAIVRCKDCRRDTRHDSDPQSSACDLPVVAHDPILQIDCHMRRYEFS